MTTLTPMSQVLHLRLRKGTNKVFLSQTNLNTYQNRDIRIQRCFVAWSLKNIRHGVNDSITVKGTATQLSPGYYTFSDLKDLLKTHKITIERLKDNKVTLQSEGELNLRDFGKLLGFDENKAITKNTKYTSVFPASMTNGLKDIKIFCSLVDTKRNIAYRTHGGYTQSDLMITLVIDTNQSLNGTFTNFITDILRLPCKDYLGQEISFIVDSSGHVDDYEIFMTLEIV